VRGAVRAAQSAGVQAAGRQGSGGGEGGREGREAEAEKEGLLGIGGGTIVTPLHALISPLPQAAVLGTSLLAMLPPSAVALAQHYRQGRGVNAK
jgi:hypothetical protein